MRRAIIALVISLALLPISVTAGENEKLRLIDDRTYDFYFYDEAKGLIKEKRKLKKYEPILENSFIEILKIKQNEIPEDLVKVLGRSLIVVYRAVKRFSRDAPFAERICIDYFDKYGEPEGGACVPIFKDYKSYVKGQMDHVIINIPEGISSFRIWLPE